LSKKPHKNDEPDDDPKDVSTLQPQPLDPKLLRYKLQMLAWIRVGLGILSGVLAATLGSYYIVESTGKVAFDPNSYVGLYVPVFIYIASYYLGKYGLGIVLPQKDKNKLITQGIGGFIMMFLFFWILYNTLCYSSGCFSFHLWSSDGIIPSLSILNLAFLLKDLIG
jgi:hypothetical protein